MKLIFTLTVIIPVALFSIFGFVASFEPVENQLFWRLFYTVLFLGCIFGAVSLIPNMSNNV